MVALCLCIFAFSPLRAGVGGRVGRVCAQMQAIVHSPPLVVALTGGSSHLCRGRQATAPAMEVTALM